MESQSVAETLIAILRQVVEKCEATGFSQDLQPKEKAGIQTDIASIRFYVPRKRSKLLLRLTHKLIPKEIGGIPTDVIEFDPVAQQNPHTQRHELLKGGISMMHYTQGAATLGIILRDSETKSPVMVSNQHVIFNLDNPDTSSLCSHVGDPQIQPGKIDGGIYGPDNIAKAYRYIGLVGTQPGTIGDAATATWNGQRTIKMANILHPGDVPGVIEPKIGMRVVACCRNGDFEATIYDVAANLQVGGYGCQRRNMYAIFRKQVLYRPGFGPGSSGTCVIEKESRKAVVLNAFGDGAAGQGMGGGAWFKEIMGPLRLEFPNGEPPEPPPPGDKSPPAETSAQFTVISETPDKHSRIKGMLKAERIKVGEDVEYSGKLEDTDTGQGLGNRQITWEDTTPQRRTASTENTGPDGSFIIRFAAQKVGSHILRIIFAGDQ